GCFALYGCATAPGYRSPAVAPTALFRGMTSADGAAIAPFVATAPSPTIAAAADSAGVATDYWDQLGDTTLSRLAREVLRANLDVQAARARVSAARSERV